MRHRILTPKFLCISGLIISFEEIDTVRDKCVRTTLGELLANLNWIDGFRKAEFVIDNVLVERSTAFAEI